jgi:nonsense-mediated mRNA decay protein 3
MDTQSAMIALQPNQSTTVATILCCNCGLPIDGTQSAGALCPECLKLTVDLSSGIQRESVLHVCGDCDRWFSPPTQWLVAQLESRELLALCLRKLKGLNRLRIIDASFVWTEPHSRRVKVKITAQQDAGEGTIVQQAFEVEYVVANQQCHDCRKSYTHHTWRAVVQVRQKVPHKRTFLYLEQLILKHGAHQDTINIKETHEGLDFYFAHRNQAEKFVDFLTSVTPVSMKKSSELISHDIHTSIKQYKFTYSAEIVPICKDDLVALPLKVARAAGNISPLALCYRVGTAVNLLNPHTLQTTDITSKQFWHLPFAPLADVSELTEFVVLDIEPTGESKGHFVLAEATISPVSNMSESFFVRTHLGGVLHPGDSVMGYYLTGANFNSPEFEAILESRQYGSTIPDVVLVKKHYTRTRKAKGRNWRLKRIGAQEASDRKGEQDRIERDYEMFLRDVEEDTEMRAGVNMYKAEKGADEMDLETEDGDGEIKIPMEELLEDFGEMHIEG